MFPVSFFMSVGTLDQPPYTVKMAGSLIPLRVHRRWICPEVPEGVSTVTERCLVRRHSSCGAVLGVPGLCPLLLRCLQECRVAGALVPTFDQEHSRASETHLPCHLPLRL